MRLIDADSLIRLVMDSTILGEGFKQAFVALVNGEPTVEPSAQPEPCEDAVSRAELLHIFEKNCYPVHYDHNSIDVGMTLPGIVEVLNIATSVTPKLELCEDVVSRRSILDKISKKDNWEKYDRYNIGLSDARQIVQDEPPVTPKRTGKWMNLQLIPDDITGHTYGECSICLKLRKVDNFCPNCGADMRGKQDGR